MTRRPKSCLQLAVALASLSSLLLAHKVAPTSVGAYYSGTKQAGIAVTFSGSGSYDNDSQNGGYTPRWRWDFQYDGSTFNERANSTSSLTSWTYPTAGVYTVAIIYYDNDNQQGNLYTFQITITGLKRFYYLKDHLGSIRAVVRGDGVTTGWDDYDPWGVQLEGRSGTVTETRYKFTGKERDIETGYDYFGARYYDSRFGRWMSVDPLARQYPALSPYHYAVDNPARVTDPNGRGPRDRIQAALNMTGTEYKNEIGLLRTQTTPGAMEFMDCSELVCRVMADDGITDGVKNLTCSGGTLAEFLESGDFVLSTTPQEGDIALWEGHTGIVSKVNANMIKLVAARGHDKLSAENMYFGATDIYSSSPFIGYFRPKKETPDGKVKPKNFVGPLPPRKPEPGKEKKKDESDERRPMWVVPTAGWGAEYGLNPI